MTAIIIEDENRSQMVLQNLLARYCPDVEVIAIAASVSDAVDTLQTTQPDVVFLDVQLSGGTGFDVLERVPDLRSVIIFTTAYDEYALKAFSFSAVDYLLKPIDIEELKAAVRRASSSHDLLSHRVHIRNLLKNLRHPDEDPVLLVTTGDGVDDVRLRDIVRCEAQGAGAILFIKKKRPLLVNRVIKELEHLLSDYGFYRVHQSHLVNLKEIRKYLRSENMLLMGDGEKIQLTPGRKDELLSALARLH
jgi:two-component system, LytTR family, response regulator